MAMLLSLRITSRLVRFEAPALFSPSKARPPVIEPSPITATTCRFSPRSSAALAMPNAAEIDTEACPPPKASYSLSDMRGKPLMPPSRRLVRKASRRPVMILWA